MSYPQPSSQPAPMSASEEQGWGVALHLGAMVAWVVAPLVIWLIFRERSRLLHEHGKTVVNWNITVVITYAVLFILAIVAMFIEFWLYFVVFGLMFLLGLVILIAGILGAVAAYKGRPFRYRLAVPFIR